MPIDVRANITGTVWKVEVSQGDLVSEKQIVVTCHQAVANVLYDEERKGLEEIEKIIRKQRLKSDN